VASFSFRGGWNTPKDVFGLYDFYFYSFGEDVNVVKRNSLTGTVNINAESEEKGVGFFHDTFSYHGFLASFVNLYHDFFAYNETNPLFNLFQVLNRQRSILPRNFGKYYTPFFT